MKFFTIFSLVFIAVAAQNFSTRFRKLTVPDNVEDFVFKENETKPPSFRKPVMRILNGKTASDEQFPFVALLAINSRSSGALCTGSLIAKNWILTARHCIAEMNAESVLVSLGSVDRESRSMTKIFSNLYIWMDVSNGKHPDISLFKLNHDAPNNNRIRPVLLPGLKHQHSRFEGVIGTAIGFGRIAGGQTSRYLQYTEFRVLKDSDCHLDDNVLCSQPPTGSSSLQPGDSGGPFVANIDGVQTLIGVNVYYVTAGSTVWQGSTNVADFLSFIHDSTGIPYR